MYFSYVNSAFFITGHALLVSGNSWKFVLETRLISIIKTANASETSLESSEILYILRVYRANLDEAFPMNL